MKCIAGWECVLELLQSGRLATKSTTPDHETNP
jgi:hypothetical protein